MAIPLSTGEMSSVALHDGHTGDLLKTLGSGDQCKWKLVRFLFDGRIVALREVDDQTELVLFSSEGTEILAMRVAKGMVVLDGETAPGRITLRALSREDISSDLRWKCFFVDLDAGHIRRHERAIRPLTGWWHKAAGIFGSCPSPGSPGSRLFIEESRRLVRLDLQTGGRTVLVGRDVGE